MPALLEVEGLTVSYDRLRAIEGVDLTVPTGHVVALLGPNGAGKSTLLRAVAGLVPIEEGTLRLSGSRIDDLPANRRAERGVCLIPEGRGIFPSMTVADNLAVALKGGARARQKVIEFFPVLGQRMGQLAGTLSGGEQQMLALARAVALPPVESPAGAASPMGAAARQSNGSGRRTVGGSNGPTTAGPTLLMADELSLGLAPLLVSTIVDTLQRLHEEEGRTILLVEQYATHALQLADLVYILDRGRVAWAGDPDELRASKVLQESYLGA
ncbi:MAG: ABC transporter ATP-binding protein [Acidimicrobiales bacterium]